MQFKKATKQQSRLRMAIVGPSGAGKTYSALAVAQELGSRVAVIDTERGSASKYADRFRFDVLELESFAPATYVEAIQAAEAAGYDVLVIDSLSHAWMGKGGALEMVDHAAKRSKSGNTFQAWRDVTPQHNALVDAILRSRCHVIATMRAKSEYVLEENERGKKVPRKVGLAPIQRDGVEFEFDVCGDLDLEHNYLVSKTRCAALDAAVIAKPGKQLAETLKAWLSDGVEAPAPALAPTTTPKAATNGNGNGHGAERTGITDAQRRMLFAVARETHPHATSEEVRAKIKEVMGDFCGGKKSTTELTHAEFERVVNAFRGMQQQQADGGYSDDEAYGDAMVAQNADE